MARNNETTVTFKVFNQEFNKAMKEMKDESSKLKQEFKLQEEQMKLNGTQSEKLSAKLEYLQKEHELASKKVQETEKQLQKAKEMYGENSDEVASLTSQLTNAQIWEQKFANQITTTNREIDKQAQATKDLDTYFEATETSIADFSNVLGQRLVHAIQDGTATSRDLENALERIGRASLGADGDINRLQSALRTVNNGNSIEDVRRDLQQLQSEAEQAEESVDDLGVSLENIAGAIGAGVGIKEVIDQALESSSLETQIDVSFRVPDESKQSVEEAIRGVMAYGFDGEEALEGVRRQWALNKDASDETNAAVIKGAQTIAKAYNGIDFNELIQETNEISGALGISNQEALALVDSLLDAGFPPEQLDTVAEYGEQLHMAGYNAEQIQNIFAAGVDTKSWNIDNLMDGLKEGRIQMADFGNGLNKEMKALIGETNISAKKFVSWGQAIAKGGKGGQKAMEEATIALAGVEDATVRNQLGTKMFGTMWEDQGTKIIDTILNAKDGTLNLKDAQNELNRKTGEFDDDPAIQMQQAIQDLKESMAPTLEIIADITSSISNWASENPKLASTISIVGVGLGILLGTLVGLAPIIFTLQSALPILGAAFTAISWPIVAIIAGIASLIAIGVLLYKNWDEITAWGKETWSNFVDWISELWSNFMEWGSEKWNSFSKWISEIWSNAVNWGKETWGSFKTWISELWSSITNFGKETWSSFKTWLSDTWNNMVKYVVEKALSMANSVITKFNNLRDGAVEKFNSMKSTVTKIVQNFKNKISEIITNVKTGFVNKVNDLRNGAVEKFTALRDKARDIMQSTKEKIISPIQSAKEKVGEIVGNIKGFFTGLKLKIPKLSMPPLPHFKLSGKFSLKPPSVPKLGVEWYRKGGIFDEASVIGIGESGKEAALPLVGKEMDPFADAVANRMLSTLPQMAQNKMSESTNNNTINFYATVNNEKDMDKLFDKADKWLSKKGDRNAAAWGGNG